MGRHRPRKLGRVTTILTRTARACTSMLTCRKRDSWEMRPSFRALDSRLRQSTTAIRRHLTSIHVRYSYSEMCAPFFVIELDKCRPGILFNSFHFLMDSSYYRSDSSIIFTARILEIWWSASWKKIRATVAITNRPIFGVNHAIWATCGAGLPSLYRPSKIGKDFFSFFDIARDSLAWRSMRGNILSTGRGSLLIYIFIYLLNIYKLLLVLMLFLPWMRSGKSNFVFIFNSSFDSGTRFSSSGKGASAFEAIQPSTTFHSAQNVLALVR